MCPLKIIMYACMQDAICQYLICKIFLHSFTKDYSCQYLVASYALRHGDPWVLGIHIKQIMNACVTTITYQDTWSVSCGQENTHIYKCVIYADQNFNLKTIEPISMKFTYHLPYKIWKQQSWDSCMFSKVIWFFSYSLFFLLRTKPEII